MSFGIKKLAMLNMVVAVYFSLKMNGLHVMLALGNVIRVETLVAVVDYSNSTMLVLRERADCSKIFSCRMER